VPVGGQRGFVGGVLATIHGEDGPWGLLAAYATHPVSFGNATLHFVRGVANNIASAIAYGRARRTFTNLIEDSPDPCARFDPDLRIRYANPAMVHATGYPTLELIGHTFRELGMMESQIEALEAIVRAVFRSGREREADFLLSSPLGDRFYHIRFVPELSTDTSVRSVLAMARDVTEHKKANEERASLQQELLERDRRDADLMQQLFAEQHRLQERGPHKDYRSQILNQLTLRETDILRLLAGGLTNRQIARHLHLSPGTVRNHLGRVFPKLDAIDRTQAAVRAVELGLVEPLSA
jgi:PAS domain S-box-containing protein